MHYDPMIAKLVVWGEEGDTVSMHYDPMIAKLVVWGENSACDLIKLNDSLSKFQKVGHGSNENGGYIRCFGRMPAVKASSSSTDPITVGQMKILLGFLRSIINNLTPNPKLSAVFKSMNIQMPKTSTGSTSTVNQSSSSKSDQMQGKMTILPFLMFHLSYICYDRL
ncbi:hypothetical protein LXL04_036168 [Taraxacum kok-saghyz]